MANYAIKKVSVVFFIREGDRFLFLKRMHTGACDGYYMFPGGHVDEGESILQAAVRELKEELDISVQPQDLVFRLIEPTLTHLNLFFEVARYRGKIKNNEPHKHSDAAFLMPDSVGVHPVCIAEVRALATGQIFMNKDDVA